MSATVAPPCATVAPRGAIVITWPAHLTTVNRRAHKQKQTCKVNKADKIFPSCFELRLCFTDP